eukprot:188922-Pyramimonas_sp.AAC.1
MCAKCARNLFVQSEVPPGVVLRGPPGRLQLAVWEEERDQASGRGGLLQPGASSPILAVRLLGVGFIGSFLLGS